MDGIAMCVGMTGLLVYISKKLFSFQDEFKQMPLRAGIFLVLTAQKFQ